MPKTAQFIEETHEAKSVKEPSTEPSAPKRKIHPNSLKNLVAPWKPGDVPNPEGKNGRDVAQEIAKAVFTRNPVMIYQAYAKALGKGNAYAFDVIASRAFGKLKEKREYTHIYEETPDADLGKRIADLERDLGLAREIDEAGRAGIAQARATAPNGHAKDTELLPK
jgi:hypothetical protein